MKQQLMMLLLGTASVFCSCETQVEQHEKNELRAPAYPLVTIDPYTSAWSTTDNLYDSPVKHWTGKDFSLLGVAKVDGQTYRFMGTEELEHVNLIEIFIKTLYLKIQERQLIHNELVAFSFDLILSFLSSRNCHV